MLLQFSCNFNGISDGQASFRPIGGRKAYKEGQFLRPYLAYGINSFEQKAHPLDKAATIFIVAMVGERRQKFMEEISMSRVDLDDFKSGCEGTLRGCLETLDHSGDLLAGERAGKRIVGRKSFSAGTDGLPASLLNRNFPAAAPGPVGAPLPPGVS